MHAEKKAIIANLVAMKAELKVSETYGLLDENSSIYNQIDNLIIETKAINIKEELNFIIIKGKSLERQLETWLSKEGRETLDLNWPKI